MCQAQLPAKALHSKAVHYSRSSSFRVTEISSNRKLVFGFLLAAYSNLLVRQNRALRVRPCVLVLRAVR